MSSGSTSPQEIVELAHMLAHVRDIGVFVFDELKALADRRLLVAFEHAGSAVRLVGAEAERAERGDTHFQGAAEGLAEDVLNAGFHRRSRTRERDPATP